MQNRCSLIKHKIKIKLGTKEKIHLNKTESPLSPARVLEQLKQNERHVKDAAEDEGEQSKNWANL